MALHTHWSNANQATAARLVPRGGLIVAETDDGRGERYARVRRAAIGLARKRDAAILLVDRSAASPLADPYPSGPWTADVAGPHGERPLAVGELRLVGREYLIAQIREAADDGVAAMAWLPRLRGPAGIADAAERSRADLALVPDEVESPSLLERVLGRSIGDYVTHTKTPLATVRPGGPLHLIRSGTLGIGGHG